MLLELLKQHGLEPQRKTSKELFSPCPACGGEDRFLIWPDKDRYWCRRCSASGDSIQYLRDFCGASYQEAVGIVGKLIPTERPLLIQQKKSSNRGNLEQSLPWRMAAARKISKAHNLLLSDEKLISRLHNERGILPKTIELFNLGWVKHDLYFDKQEFGLEPDGKKLFIPSGLLIPWKDTRIRIRRDIPGNQSKYHVVKGSILEPFTIGSAYENTAIIVESELDAILLSQEIEREVLIVAMGSAQAKPDKSLLERLNYSPIVLVALDNDEAGWNASERWKKYIGNSFRGITPSRYGKDINESFQNRVGLNDWISAALELLRDQITLKN